jgi:hypothetical protein
MIGGIVVGFGGYLLYNTVNKAGANSSRVVRESLLAEAMAAHRGDRVAWLQGPSAVVALPAACRVNTGPFMGTTLYSPYF